MRLAHAGKRLGAIETIIIGGGISGLSCARRLCDSGRDFLLLTDRLGGRMLAADYPGANLGASYITSDYKYVGRYVARGPRIRLRDVYFDDGGQFLTIWNPRNLRRLKALARLYFQLIVFRRHLNRLRAASPFVCQAQLRARDPLLTRCTEEPATEFIRTNGLEEIDEIFTNPIIHSTVFVPTTAVNTFYYLAALMPILLPTFLGDFRQTQAKLIADYESRILHAHVLRLEEDGDGYRVIVADGEFQARHVVISTPCHNLRAICPSLDQAHQQGVREIPMWTLHVQGRRRPGFQPGKIVFLRPGQPATILLPLPAAGCELLFSHTGQPDLSPFYESYEVVRRAAWNPAIILSGGIWRPLAPRPNLFTIGDYNICGLEDSFLTGLFAANRILKNVGCYSSP